VTASFRRVIVSGTGIGRAVARRFALAGDEVTILGRREAVLNAAAAEINAEVGEAFVRALAADV
jgi:3-oxoacyl-[acyl-carrier protein] reductase